MCADLRSQSTEFRVGQFPLFRRPIWQSRTNEFFELLQALFQVGFPQGAVGRLTAEFRQQIFGVLQRHSGMDCARTNFSFQRRLIQQRQVIEGVPARRQMRRRLRI